MSDIPARIGAPAPGYPRRTSQLVAGLAFFAALAWTWSIYVPGLNGYFAFDDYPNLTPLEAVNCVLTTRPSRRI